MTRTQLAQVPVLIVRSEGQAGPLSTVLWLHGFGAAKDLHLPELRRFAEAGLLAVGIDAVGHGQRRLADFPPQFSRNCAASVRLFNSVVSGTVAELPQLIDALVENGLCDPQRVAVAGVSMGGCIVYGAITVDRRIRAAVALLASPESVWSENPDGALDRFFPTALLSITAAQDVVVPPAAARALHVQLAPRYRLQPERLRYVEIAGASHFMLAADWDRAVEQACTWLSRFLS